MTSSKRDYSVTPMPTVLRVEGFKPFFYSNESILREPPHVHVRQDGADAKFWLRPEVGVARSVGLDARTLAHA